MKIAKRLTALRLVARLTALFACGATVFAAAVAHAQTAVDKEHAARIAVETLSRKYFIDADSIDVINVAVIDWPDSSLGCPSAGVEYMQVEMRGTVVLLRADSKAYRVHTANDRAIVCDKLANPRQSFVPRAPGGMALGNLILAAKADLAERLGFAPADVSMGLVKSVTWPNAALGCPVPQQEYADQPVEGFAITLDHGGQSFIYHTDQERVIPCPAIELK